MRPNFTTIYAASCQAEGCVARYALTDEGLLRFIDALPLPFPMYMALDGERLHVVLRRGGPDGTSAACASEIREDGSLAAPSALVSTRGTVACHIAVMNGAVYCANYSSGSLIRLPDRLVSHSGRSVHPTRQTAPYVHQVQPTPDGRYLCAADLGLDKLMVYDADLNAISETVMPAGAGPRHVAFAPNGRHAYCVNELDSTVTPLAYERGRLTILGESLSMLPDDFHAPNTAAAIRVSADGEYLYASNRGHDSIACFRLDTEGLPHPIGIVPCGGRGPRDFIVFDRADGRWMIIANEAGGVLRAARVEDGLPRLLPQEMPLSQVLCVLAR